MEAVHKRHPNFGCAMAEGDSVDCPAAPDVWGVLRLRQQPQAAPPGDAASVLPFRAQWQGSRVLQSPATGGTRFLTSYLTS